jgi:hypothetical protein
MCPVLRQLTGSSSNPTRSPPGRGCSLRARRQAEEAKRAYEEEGFANIEHKLTRREEVRLTIDVHIYQSAEGTTDTFSATHRSTRARERERDGGGGEGSACGRHTGSLPPRVCARRMAPCVRARVCVLSPPLPVALRLPPRAPR